jgi:hypothetical protein
MRIFFIVSPTYGWYLSVESVPGSAACRFQTYISSATANDLQKNQSMI